MTESNDRIDDSIAAMQFEINQRMYADILGYYQILLDQTDPTTSIRLMISALATNLGAIIAQLPHAHQEKYLLASKEILDASISMMAEDIAATRWGNVGHA